METCGRVSGNVSQEEGVATAARPTLLFSSLSLRSERTGIKTFNWH